MASTNDKYLGHNRGAMINPDAAMRDAKNDPLSKGVDVWSTKGDGWELTMVARKPRALDRDQEPGPHIGLKFVSIGNGVWDKLRVAYCTFALTSMTMKELDAFEQMIRKVIENARTVVEARDAYAKALAESGDDSLSRAYRTVPQVVRRSRYVDEHGNVVWDNLAAGTGLHDGDGDD